MNFTRLTKKVTVHKRVYSFPDCVPSLMKDRASFYSQNRPAPLRPSTATIALTHADSDLRRLSRDFGFASPSNTDRTSTSPSQVSPLRSLSPPTPTLLRYSDSMSDEDYSFEFEPPRLSNTRSKSLRLSASFDRASSSSPFDRSTPSPFERSTPSFPSKVLAAPARVQSASTSRPRPIPVASHRQRSARPASRHRVAATHSEDVLFSAVDRNNTNSAVFSMKNLLQLTEMD